MKSLSGRVVAAFIALTTALFAAFFLASCTNPPASDGHTDHTHDSSSTASGEAKPADFNDADVAFVTDMIPHHEQAVALSALVPQRSSDPALVELAAAISAAQGPEIQTMKAFLVQWTGGESGHEGHDMGAMQMPGMVDDATMKKLETLNGKEFDTLWLQSMISHHEGAIEMANVELRDGVNADAKSLAGHIVELQQAEIDQMKQMLGG